MLNYMSQNGHAEVVYLFIDGNYFGNGVKDLAVDWFGAEIEDFDYRGFGEGFKKIFYYDCLPAKTGADTDQSHDGKKEKKLAFFKMLRTIKGWHVNEGLAKYNRKQGQYQKEVDILISVDMLTHAYRKNMDKVVFIAGDQDFRPLLEAVTREGMYVELKYFPDSISEELLDAADSREPFGLDDLYRYFGQEFRSKNPLPNVSISGVVIDAQGWRHNMGGGCFNITSSMKKIECSVVDNAEIASIYLDSADSYYHLLYRISEGVWMPFSYKGDIEFLKRYFSYKCGELKWSKHYG